MITVSPSVILFVHISWILCDLFWFLKTLTSNSKTVHCKHCNQEIKLHLVILKHKLLLIMSTNWRTLNTWSANWHIDFWRPQVVQFYCHLCITFSIINSIIFLITFFLSLKAQHLNIFERQICHLKDCPHQLQRIWWPN